MLLAAVSFAGGEGARAPQFKFVGGTEAVAAGCEGNLELAVKALNFICPQGSISVPYSSINFMQFRPDVSKKVWKLKLKWKVRPQVTEPLVGGKHNRYFTVVYDKEGTPEAMVLAVSPQAMRPYLAEIDLKSGKRVEVKSFEEY